MDQIGLVERARQGDRHAFADLIRASGARLDATARLILRDPELAQDAVQETLIRAWRSLPGLRDPASFDHWLHSLVVNACIDLIRRRKRRVIEVDVEPILEFPTHDDTGRIADRDQLDRALARLEPEARAVVVLHFYLDLPLPQVAAMLRIPVGNCEVAAPPLPRHAPLFDGDRRGDRDNRPGADHRRAGRMTMHDQRFDRALPNLFVELASASTPDYLEAAIERASSRPQRPAWTYPGRWLPVDITTQAAPAARMPWRQIGILALIGLLLAVAAVAYVGARRDPSPAPPFGLAANGAIAMERGGDIVTVDHATGTVTQVTTGPEVDNAPVFFRDGTRIAFERLADGPGPVDGRLIMVANADGSGITQATPEPFAGLQLWTLSPDGRDLLVTTNAGGAWKLTSLAVDGSREPTPIDISLPGNLDELEPASYRPPDGREILVVAKPAGSPTRGIYVSDAATGKTLRTIVEPSQETDVSGASWSPTGDAISYGRFAVAGDGFRVQQHVVAADGTGDRQIDAEPGTTFNAAVSQWSNDGSRLVVVRGDGTAEQALIVSTTGDAPAVELTCGLSGVTGCPGVTWIWSPDDTVLVGTLSADDGSATYYLADPETGRVTPTEWTGIGAPDWQRSAP